jgi:hypothetical protein
LVVLQFKPDRAEKRPPMASKKQTRKAVPYGQIATMWKQGKSYEEIAKATRRFAAKKDDPTKPVRAIVSIMLNKGYKDANGRHHVLPVREQMRNQGVNAKAGK